jgi:molybdopterin converting factor small subunit
MKITVKLFATLRLGRFDQKTIECDEGVIIHDLVKMLQIPEKDAAIIFVNCRHAEFGTVLKEGDTLAIFPPVGGG